MPIVIRIFQSANDRRRCADQPGEIALALSGRGAKVVDVPRHVGIGFSSTVREPRTQRVFERSKRLHAETTSQALTPLEDSLRARLSGTRHALLGEGLGGGLALL